MHEADARPIDAIREAATQWRAERYGPEAASLPEEAFVTSGRVPLQPLYTPADLEGRFEYLSDCGFPGEFPYTRGRRPGMYRTKLWDMGTYAGFGSAKATNERYRYILDRNRAERDRNTLSVAIDLPSQLGLDPDSHLARGEVGTSGVSMASLWDAQDLLRDIPLDRVRLRTVSNSMGSVALAWFVAAAESYGYGLEDLDITLQNDPLKEFTGRGTYIYPPGGHVKLSCDAIEYGLRNAPHWHPVSVCGSQMSWAGATAVEEVAVCLSHARVYLDELVRRGYDVDQIAPLMQLHVGTDIDLFEQAAKFRVIRKCWARLLRDVYGATSPEALAVGVQTYTGGYNLTAQEPLNNIVRIAVQVLAAVLGGADQISTCSFDEAISTPSKEALAVAMRTQQIIAEEARVAQVVDPLGGSYFIESLTKELDDRVQALLARIEEVGGGLAAVETGFTQSLLDDLSYRYYREITSGERPLVGVNRYVSDEPTHNGVRAFRSGGDTRPGERIQELRATRDPTATKSALGALRDAVVADENTMEATIAAVKALATIGEITDVFRGVYGVFTEPVAI